MHARLQADLPIGVFDEHIGIASQLMRGILTNPTDVLASAQKRFAFRFART